jgi:hypothetical protein
MLLRKKAEAKGIELDDRAAAFLVTNIAPAQLETSLVSLAMLPPKERISIKLIKDLLGSKLADPLKLKRSACVLDLQWLKEHTARAEGGRPLEGELHFIWAVLNKFDNEPQSTIAKAFGRSQKGIDLGIASLVDHIDLDAVPLPFKPIFSILCGRSAQQDRKKFRNARGFIDPSFGRQPLKSLDT